MSNRSRAASLGLAVLALAIAPAAASATLTISYAPDTGALVQGDGASDGVSVGDPFGAIRFLPTGQGGADGGPVVTTGTLVAGSGCTAGQGESPARPPGSVVCARTGSGLVTANLGASNDAFLANGYSADVFAFGQEGDDVLKGDVGFDLLDGGLGNDFLRGDSGGGTDSLLGREGNDRLVASLSSTGSIDRFDGGPGTDVADYSARSTAVTLKATVGTTGANDDGSGGGAEGDGLESVETLIGGSGGDVLEFRSVLRSSPAGTRTIRGNGGRDTVRAVGAVTTSLDGGLDEDTVTGGSGIDSIFAREGVKDTITCGGSNDTLNSDLRDIPLAADCETVDQGAVLEGRNVSFRTRVVRVEEDGSLRMRLACPRSVDIGCRGELAARLDRRGAGFGSGKRYSLRAGRAKSVEVRLPASQVARARRRGARVRVRSIETGEHGPKTTLRSVAARKRG